MGRLTHYVFRDVWSINASFDDVCAVLADVTTYPTWWPEIRTVTSLGDGRFELVARSLLPYELCFLIEQHLDDRRSGVLVARLTGDLGGFARWSVNSVGANCTLVYDQEVDTHRALLNVLAPLARPAFRMNHAVMMRHGQAGCGRSWPATPGI